MLARPALKPVGAPTPSGTTGTPSTGAGTGVTGLQKTTSSVGRLAGQFNPVSISTQRTAATTNRGVASPTSTIAAAKAALFERSQAASPTTPTANPLRTSISSVSSISSMGS